MDVPAAMERALELAWGGWGRVGRNPLVGAVVLRDGQVVGEGHHEEFGGPHGEVLALLAAGERARGADLVVTLEPCAHHGKTPPCTDAIVAAGIRRVFYAARDEDPAARGGAEVLERAGVAVQGGVMEATALAQNAVFFHRFAGADRPFVALKLAMSVDARIADVSRRSRWVSGEEAREFVQWLRAGYDAIAVGAGTARSDDPSLTVRGPVQPTRPPLRVVFARRGEVPPDGALVRGARDAPTLAVTEPGTPTAARRALEAAGVEVAQAATPVAALELLHAREVGALLVEGGGVLAGSLLEEGLVDRVYLVVAPIWLGEEGVRAFSGLSPRTLDGAPRWRTVERRALGDDTLIVLDRG